MSDCKPRGQAIMKRNIKQEVAFDSSSMNGDAIGAKTRSRNRAEIWLATLPAIYKGSVIIQPSFPFSYRQGQVIVPLSS